MLYLTQQRHEMRGESTHLRACGQARAGEPCLEGGPALVGVAVREHVGRARGAALRRESLPEELHVLRRVRERVQEVAAPAPRPCCGEGSDRVGLWGAGSGDAHLKCNRAGQAGHPFHRTEQNDCHGEGSNMVATYGLRHCNNL